MQAFEFCILAFDRLAKSVTNPALGFVNVFLAIKTCFCHFHSIQSCQFLNFIVDYYIEITEVLLSFLPRLFFATFEERLDIFIPYCLYQLSYSFYILK